MKTLLDKLFESFDSDIYKLETKLIGMGYNVSRKDDIPKAQVLKVVLGDMSEYTPTDLVTLSDSLEGYSSLLMVDSSVNKSTNNYVSFIFPEDKTSRDTVYHVTSGKWVESIRDKGLLVMRPTEGSDNINHHEDDRSFRDRKYKASFVVGTIEDAHKVNHMYEIENPHLITIDATGINLYPDPMMPTDMDSLVSFRTFEPHRIQSIKNI